MIKVTLEFADAQAVVDFFAGKAAVQTAAAPSPAPKPSKAEKPAAPASAPAAPSAPATKPAAAQPAAIEYPTLQKAVFALAADDKDAVVGLIKQFGVDSFKVLDPSRYAEALAAVEAKHAEVKAAKAAAAEMA